MSFQISARSTLFLLTLLTGCDLFKSDNGGDGASGAKQVSTFSKSYGGPADDTASAARATRDGGFIFVGHAGFQRLASSPTAGGDLWINKLDANGNVEAQRLIGGRPTVSAGSADVTFEQARPTPDGGYILAGTAQILDDRNQNGRQEHGENFTTSDIAVTKLDAEGATEWTRVHDTGGWLNYAYYLASDEPALARDLGKDIWPLEDGGYLVAGASYGNLEDTHGLGFPADTEDQEDHPNDPAHTSGQPGGRYNEAVSVVALRLNAGGDLLWVTRLTENAFNRYLQPWNAEVRAIIRPTAGGGVVLARGTLAPSHGVRLPRMYRLLGDGSILWSRLLGEDCDLIPTDIEQTDDVPDIEFGVRDGLKNDGFLLSSISDHSGFIDQSSNTHCGRTASVTKLTAGGEIEWSTGDWGDSALHYISDVRQTCAGANPVCIFVAAGWIKDSGPQRAWIQTLDSQGGTLISHEYPELRSVERITDGDDGAPFRALARGEGAERWFLELDRRTFDRQPQRERRTTVFAETAEFTADGGAALFSDLRSNPRITKLDDGASVRQEIQLDREAARTDRALAVEEVAPGQFIIAGDSSSFIETDGETDGEPSLPTAWALRYDLPADRVIWQTRFRSDRDAIGNVERLAASGDGGVVLGGLLDGGIRLWKLGEGGGIQWATPPLLVFGLEQRGELRELHALPDGGFAALALGPGEGISRVEASGAIRWRLRYKLSGRSLSLDSLHTVDDEGDGARDDGYIAAATPLEGKDGVAIILRLDPDGQTQWAESCRLPAFSGGAPPDFSVTGIRIRQAPDGGYVLGGTEKGMLDSIEEDGKLTPLGQGNILLMKLDAAGVPQWARIYGGLLEETLNDLEVLPDGVILVAGYSDSLGERREAWLMKLGPDGFINGTSCNALIAEIPGSGFRTEPVTVTPEPMPAIAEVSTNLIAIDTGAPTSTAEGFVTARQCVGDAVLEPPAPRQNELTLDLTGSGPGRVTSSPAALDCTSDCSASFARGAVVTLTAEAAADSRFVGWSGCDEVTEDGRCRVTMAEPRTVSAEFAPDSGGETVPGANWVGHWEDEYSCGQDCGPGPEEPFDGVDQLEIRVDLDGDVTIENLTGNITYTGSIQGDTLTWSGTSTLDDGRTLSEDGSFTLLPDGRTFSKTSSFSTTGSDDTPACSGECTGTGHKR